MQTHHLVSLANLESQILLIRNHKVMLSNTLAALYGVKTSALIQAVKRNTDRFPEDFMFELSNKEFKDLKRLFPNIPWGRRNNPYAFTQEGVAMLSSVLKSQQAIQVNIEIMCIFVRLRKKLATNEDLRKKLISLESKYDHQFKVVFDAIKDLITTTKEPKRKIGFIINDD